MESKLEKYLSKELYTRFGQYSIRQNYRPDWMEGLELDFYIDELKIAAEVQGDQHYGFVEYFHRTIENFEAQKKRDSKKKFICASMGIRLFEIFTEKDADLFVNEIKELCSEVEKLYVHEERSILKRKRIDQMNLLKAQGVFKNRKDRKKEDKNTPERVTKRLVSCIENIRLYDSGLIVETKEKYEFWRKVVANKGVVFDE